MNWEMVTAVLAILGIATTICSVAFISGRLTQQISDSRREIESHGDMLESHAKILNEHEVELAKLNEWKSGYNAAANVAGIPKQGQD